MSPREDRTTRVALRFSCLFVASLLQPMTAQQAQAQDARFRVTLSWTQHEIAPTRRSRPTSSTYLITLHGGKTVKEEFTRQYGPRSGQVRTSSRSSELGEDMNRRFPAQWTVINDRTLLRVTARPSHTFAIWLRTRGDRSCTASVEWRLKPGFSSYETWAPARRVKMIHAEPTDQRATCEVL